MWGFGFWRRWRCWAKRLRVFRHAALWVVALPLTTAGDMHFPGRDWNVAPPEAEALDSARLGDAVEFFRTNAGRDGLRELLIVRNGRVIWQGDNTTNVHGVWSVTKSFTSTCLGLLVDDGRCSLETRATSLVPSLAQHYGELMLCHFTTMTSGYRAVGDETSGG